MRNLTISCPDITPTAWGIAYQRTLTDIPYAQEIFGMLGAMVGKGVPEEWEKWKYPQLTPMLEARYKMVDLLLAEHDAERGLEIAAGFSPRGMEKTKNPDTTYVEMDLLPVMLEKRRIVQTILGHIPSRLYLETGSVLEYEDLSRAALHFESGPIHVVHEGLLRYLNLEEKTTVAHTVHRLLAEHDGAWITPDVCARGMNATGALKHIVRAQNEQMLRMTGIDVRKNYFGNEQEARAFFESMGFSVERRSFDEVREKLVSPQREGLNIEQINDSIGDSAVYVMRVDH